MYGCDGRGLMLWLLPGPTGFTCRISFAMVFSFFNCSQLSPLTSRQMLVLICVTSKVV